jgi:asparagine synthase (glutamine-hydrolysing)
MCGILACVALDGAPAPSFAADLSGIVDRGPDNVGEFHWNSASLFHTRLAVIDTKQSSNQPIVNRGQILVCNGEILNHLDLRREAGDFTYLTTSDCEAVMHVYRRKGVAGFCDLDGFFSFTLLDCERNVLILHRDRVGKKPLFWGMHGSRFVCASNVTAVVNNLPGQPTIDREQILHYWQHGFVHPLHSIFKGVKPVAPGEVVTIDLHTGAITTSTLEQPTRSVDLGVRSDNEIQSELRSRLRRAVEKRMAGLDTPVLIFSGGIDSTVLACEMTELRQDTRLITLKQPLPWLNDEIYAREAARKLDAPLINVSIAQDLLKNIESAVRRLDQPLGLESYLFLSLLAIQARKTGNVLFTGDGADEVFFGYREAKDWIGGQTPSLLDPVRSGPDFSFPLSDYGIQQGTIDLVGHGFVKVDKATAENQMEARCPFLDWDLMDFVRRLPAEYWLRHSGTTKYPLKRYLEERGFRKGFVHRPKLGFAYPLRYMMLSMIPTFRRSVLRSAPLLAELGADVRPSMANTFTAFRHFPQTWKAYVLSEFLARAGAAP